MSWLLLCIPRRCEGAYRSHQSGQQCEQRAGQYSGIYLYKRVAVITIEDMYTHTLMHTQNIIFTMCIHIVLLSLLITRMYMYTQPHSRSHACTHTHTHTHTCTHTHTHAHTHTHTPWLAASS